jgi:hypothetical protein
LKADHREAKLMSALAESHEEPEREKVADELSAALTLHIDIEERVLYPLVSKEVGEEDEVEGEIEHRLARDVLATMMSMVDKRGFGASVEMLKGGILHHVEGEATEISSELNDALEQADRLELGDSIAAAKAAAGQPVTATGRKSPKRRPGSTKAVEDCVVGALRVGPTHNFIFLGSSPLGRPGA